MNDRIKRAAMAAAVLFVYFFSMMGMQLCLADASRLYSQWSLRYDEPITQENARKARQYCEASEKKTWLTFWTQNNLDFAAEYNKSTAKSILYSGDPSVIAELNFINGTYPGSTDISSVIISENLSWILFGSTDTLGLSVKIDGKEKIIKGVFSDSFIDAMMYTDQESFTNTELISDGNLSFEDANELIPNLKLGNPAAMVDGAGIVSALRLIALLPLAALFISAVFLLVRLRRKKMWILRFSVVFISALVFAISLENILGGFPSWLIPTRWSDLSFWSQLLAALQGHINSWFSLSPTYIDIEFKWQILKFAPLLLISILTVIILYFKLKTHIFSETEHQNTAEQKT